MGRTKWAFWTAWRQTMRQWQSHYSLWPLTSRGRFRRWPHCHSALSQIMSHGDQEESDFQEWNAALDKKHLAEILNATSLTHDSWLLDWEPGHLYPWYHPATLKMCSVPSMHQIGLQLGSAGCLIKNICSILFPKLPGFPVMREGERCCHA